MMTMQQAADTLHAIAMAVRPQVNIYGLELSTGHSRTELSIGRVDCYTDASTRNPGGRAKHVRVTWKLNGKRISSVDLMVKLRDA